MPDAVGQLRAVQLLHRRLVVEQVDVLRPARLKQVDHTLRSGSQMRKERPRRGTGIIRQQTVQCHRAQAPSGVAQKSPYGQ